MSRIGNASFVGGPPPTNLFNNIAGSSGAADQRSLRGDNRSLVPIGDNRLLVPIAPSLVGRHGNEVDSMARGAQIALKAFEISAVMNAAAVNQLGSIYNSAVQQPYPRQYVKDLEQSEKRERRKRQVRMAVQAYRDKNKKAKKDNAKNEKSSNSSEEGRMSTSEAED